VVSVLLCLRIPGSLLIFLFRMCFYLNKVYIIYLQLTFFIPF